MQTPNDFDQLATIILHSHPSMDELLPIVEKLFTPLTSSQLRESLSDAYSGWKEYAENEIAYSEKERHRKLVAELKRHLRLKTAVLGGRPEAE